MKLPEIAIKNHQFTIIIALLLVLSGVFSFLTMPYSEDPSVAKAGASVVVLYPGANPTDMEQLVVDPIEEAVDELDDVKTISSYTRDGYAVIDVEFDSGSDPDKKYSDVTEKVNSIRSDLPDEIAGINLHKWGVANVNILQVAIVSDTANYSEMEKQTEKLKKKLIKIDGIKTAETYAFPKQEVRIALNLDKMSQMRISLNQLFGAIQSSNLNIPGGNIDIDTKTFNVQTNGSYKSLEDIGNTIINSNGQSIVYLKDVADVHFDYEDKTYIARFAGKRAVFVTATQKDDTNIFKIFRNVKRTISDFENQLPASMTTYYVFDQSKSVATHLKRFGMEMIQGMILVILIVLLFMNFRTSIIVMLALPMSIAIGVGFVDLTGYGIQQMTITGMIIVLGMLVDDAIVVTQNASRFLRMGFSPRDSAIKGTDQIQWAIISCTATTVLSFIPLAMVRDVTGDYLRSMPIIVSYTLIASLFIALTFTPYLLSKFLKPENISTDNKSSAWDSFVRVPSRIRNIQYYIVQHPYRKFLGFALSHGKTIIFISVIIFLGSLALFPFIGKSLFPKAEKPNLVINVNAPKGTNIDKTNEIAKYVESVLISTNEVKHYATNVGYGNPQIYYNVSSKSRDSAYAQFFIELKKYDRKMMANLLSELREKFANYPDARIDVKELEQGTPVEAPIAIRIIGENLDIIEKTSSDIEKIVSSSPGTINVDNPLGASKMELHINVNREKSAMLGVQLYDIDKTVRACVTGMAVSKYRDIEGKEYDIVVRLPVDKKTAISDLDKIYLTSVMGVQIPLRSIASYDFVSSAQEINHYDLDRSVTITADVLGNYAVNKVTKEIVSKLNGYNWKEGYRYEVGGESESGRSAFSGLGRAMILAMIAIFAVLVMQFKSFTQPLIIFVSVPLAIIGSLLALFITHNSFSFTAFVGLTSLIGIVVRNAIILIEYTNQLRAEGKDLVSAVKEAGETRFQPIILTTATTIGGLLPLTLQGGTMWAPAGWVIIGGLTVSTILTLVVIPVLYIMFSSKSAMEHK